MRSHFSHHKRGPALVLALILLAAFAGLLAALTLGNADGLWSNARNLDDGTSVACLQYVGDNTVGIAQGDSSTDENGVRYGRTTSDCDYSQSGFDDKSGFGFDGTDGPLLFNPGEVFVLGSFTHYNNPIQCTNCLGTVDLAITLQFTDPVLSATFDYTMTLDETPNDPEDNPGDVCPYGDSTGDGCDDKVTFPASLPDQVIDVGGKTYTLQIVGFVPGTTCPAEITPVDNFVTGEDQQNDACLFGRILEVTYDFGDAPDTGGQTTLPNGARHAIDPEGPFLGAVRPDWEADGQPHATAAPDDTTGTADEDGFANIFPDADFSDGSGSIEVTVGGIEPFSSACVAGWIDWAGDGFANDTAATLTVTANGAHTLLFSNAPGTLPANAYLRLRIVPGECAAVADNAPSSTAATPGASGLEQGGEVEDFLIAVPSAVTLRDLGVRGGAWPGAAPLGLFALLGALSGLALVRHGRRRAA